MIDVKEGDRVEMVDGEQGTVIATDVVMVDVGDGRTRLSYRSTVAKVLESSTGGTPMTE